MSKDRTERKVTRVKVAICIGDALFYYLVTTDGRESVDKNKPNSGFLGRNSSRFTSQGDRSRGFLLQSNGRSRCFVFTKTIAPIGNGMRSITSAVSANPFDFRAVLFQGSTTGPLTFSFNQTQSTAKPFEFSSIRPSGPNNTTQLPFDNPPSNNTFESVSEQNLNALHALNVASGFHQQSQNQPIPSLVFTSTKQKQDHNTNTASSPPASMVPKKSSTPTTPISQQPSSFNAASAGSETLISAADQSLLGKMVNKKLQDDPNSTVDRSDPNTPLYSLKSFEELNLHPDILKGEHSHHVPSFLTSILFGHSGVYQMGFRTPSRIQEITLPHMMKNPPSKSCLRVRPDR